MKYEEAYQAKIGQDRPPLIAKGSSEPWPKPRRPSFHYAPIFARETVFRAGKLNTIKHQSVLSFHKYSALCTLSYYSKFFETSDLALAPVCSLSSLLTDNIN